MSHKIIAVALPIEEKLLAPLRSWGKRFDWSHIKEVHLVHVVKKTITPLEFGLMEMPDAKAFESMKPTLNTFMREEARRIIFEDFRGEVFFHLSLDFNPDEAMVNLLKEFKASLVVVSTAGKHGFEGLFHSSFTDHMVKFAPCDVYVVRP